MTHYDLANAVVTALIWDGYSISVKDEVRFPYALDEDGNTLVLLQSYVLKRNRDTYYLEVDEICGAYDDDVEEVFNLYDDRGRRLTRATVAQHSLDYCVTQDETLVYVRMVLMEVVGAIAADHAGIIR